MTAASITRSFHRRRQRPGWIDLGGYTNSDPHPVYDGTRVRVVVRGGDNNLFWQAPGFVGWTGLTAVGLSEPAVTNVP